MTFLRDCEFFADYRLQHYFSPCVDTGGLQQHEQVSVPMSYVRSADKVAVVAVPAILISLAFWLITHLHIYVQLLRSPRPGPGSSTFTIIHSLITS